MIMVPQLSNTEHVIRKLLVFLVFLHLNHVHFLHCRSSSRERFFLALDGHYDNCRQPVLDDYYLFVVNKRKLFGSRDTQLEYL
jgi:hypothetical protein